MLKILIIALLVYSLACFFLYVKQRSFLYFPTPETFSANAEPVWIQTDETKLKSWKVNDAKPAIIYFGGNAEAIENNIPDFKQTLSGYSVYLVNYRGYGGSSGSPTEQGLFDDALSVYDQLQKKHTSISVIGRSLGSGVACYLASKRKVEKLLLITPYDSILQLAQSHYPIFPVKWLLKDHFESTLYAPSVKNQTLVVYAEHDRVVPLKHTKNLLKFLPSVMSRLINGSAHNDISSKPEFQQSMSDFFS